MTDLAPPAGFRSGRRSAVTGTGMVVALGWSAAVAGAALVAPPVSGLLAPVYLLGAVVIGVYWFQSGQARATEAALWLWVLAPGVRRCVDLTSGFHADSFVLLAAPVLSLVCGAAALRSVLRSPGPLARLQGRVVVAVVFAAAVAVVVGLGAKAAGVAALQVLGPLALGLSLVAPGRRDDVRAVLRRFVRWMPLLVGGYGIIQFLVAPPWDRQWLIDVSDVATSFGRPYPLEIRVFSTVNDPGSLAIVLALCLLALLTSRRPGALGVAALVVGAVCLGLTLVRSSWIVVAVGIVFLLLRGWIRPERVAALALALGVALTAFSTVAQPVVERFTETTDAGTQDESLQARSSFQSLYFAQSILDPIGGGLGSAGTAARRDTDGDQSFVNTDSGYLELMRTYGGVLGSLLVVTVVGTCWSAAFGRSAPGMARGASAFAFAIPVQLAFSNVFVSVTGAMLWTALAIAMAGRLDTGPASAPSDAPEPPQLVPQSRSDRQG